MPIGYLRREPPASIELIAQLEGRIGHSLPDDYRQYLLQQDGGRIDNNTRAVDTVFSLGDVPDYASMWDKLGTYQERVPSWLLPVADDSTGNLYAISVRPDDYGSVWFWDHEEEADEGDPPSEDNITRTAQNWAVFLDSLQAL